MRLTTWLYLFFLFIGPPCSFRLLKHLLSVYHLCLYGRIAPTVLKVEKQAAREEEKSQKKQPKESLLGILTKNPK
jgi:hypothetical protein